MAQKNNRYYISYAISSSLEHPSPAGLIKTPIVIGKFSFQWESWGGRGDVGGGHWFLTTDSIFLYAWLP